MERMNRFHPITPEEIPGNIITRISREWFLLSTGPQPGCNMLTGSWGLMGTLWHRPVFTVFVRSGRYTRELLDRYDGFCLNFFGEGFRETLQFCGTRSGRDVNKVRESGLTVFEPEPGLSAFQEAELVLVCRKLYRMEMDPSLLLDSALQQQFGGGDPHIAYTGSIDLVLSAVQRDGNPI